MMKARYTKTFFDFINDNPSFLDELIVDFIDDEHSNKLKDIIKAKWNIYEIGGETDSEFMRWFIDDYNLNKLKYEEMIKLYETKFDLLDSIKDTDAYNSNTTTSSHNNIDDIDVHYDLPNSNASKEFPSYKNINNTDNDNTYNGTTNNTRVRTNGMSYLVMKREYIRQIRNVYEEFAEEFRKDFILIYE